MITHDERTCECNFGRLFQGHTVGVAGESASDRDVRALGAPIHVEHILGYAYGLPRDERKRTHYPVTTGRIVLRAGLTVRAKLWSTGCATARKFSDRSTQHQETSARSTTTREAEDRLGRCLIWPPIAVGFMMHHLRFEPVTTDEPRTHIANAV